jgi:diacylglycerol kinase family enzyme
MTAADRLRTAIGWRPVARPQHPVLFINPRSGDGTAVRLSLAQRAQALGIEPIVLEPEDDLAALVAEAVATGADALGAAGGDGSLAIVAAAACAHDLPFACVPAGTRNHFARDLGVARHDVVGALEAFTDGLERRIDVAEVNGSMFMNNVILGFYGDAVRREDYRDARMHALVEEAREALGPRAPASGLVVEGDDEAARDPAVVMVSNNPYAVDRRLARETRARLDSGLLGVVVLDRPGSRRRLYRAWTTPSLEVGAPGPVHAGRDGEAIMLTPPLRFATRPLALRVRLAARHPGASPAAQLAALPAAGSRRPRP